jgi:S1-C subfamily serine protease
MTNGIIIRLAGVEHPVTRIFQQDAISVGTAADCDVVIAAESFALPPDATILTLRLREGAYRITAVEPMAGVTRDGEGIAIGEVVHDGDTFYFAATGIRLRFFALSSEPEFAESLKIGTAVLARPVPLSAPSTSAPAVRRRRSVPRTDVALVFVKQLLRELVSEIPRRILYAIGGLAAFILLTIIYFNLLGFLEGRRNNKAIQQLQQGIAQTQQEVERIRQELLVARQESQSALTSLSLPETVINKFGGGVCLIYGTYVFVDPRVGREARLKEPSTNDNPIGPDGSVNLSADGAGRIYEIEFTGTGFVAEKGLVLTNRHVVQAWDEDDLASLIKMRGFRPRLRELLAYFPQARQPFKLTPVETLADQDVALCTFEPGDSAIPILPLEEKTNSVASGQQVVLLGYPLGLEGLRARVDDINGSRRWGNISYRVQLNELASKSKIRPQSTAGYISDTSPQLVYDARTDEGGSGGPVFGSSGSVIGINQAILLNSQSTTNFGVPIRYGLDLIKKYKTTQATQSAIPLASEQPKT